MEKRSKEEIEKRKQRLADAIKLQEIEGNPLTPEEISMFEMFEREGWSHEKRREYILAGLKDNTDDQTFTAE